MLLVPYWRLSGYYFFYFAFIGAFSPYFGLYLQSLAFSAWDISVLMTQMQVMRLAGPVFWSALVDRVGARMMVIRVTGAITLAVFCVFFFVARFDILLISLALFAFFWVAALPLVETLTFDHLRDEPAKYSRIRLWGSVGFIVAVLGVGALLDHWPLSSLLGMCVLCLAGIVLCGFVIPETHVPHPHESHLPIGRILRQPRVCALLAACFAMSAAHGALNVFYSIFLSDHGYSKSMVGGLWTLGVVAEIAVFFFMAHTMKRFGLRQILLAGAAAAVVRFVTIGQAADQWVVLALAQLLHGLTFGAFHSAAITAVNRWFPGNTRSRGQALYSSLSFGAGGAVGGLVSGWSWDRLGSGMTFAFGSLFALAGLVLVYVWVLGDSVSQNGRKCVVECSTDL